MLGVHRFILFEQDMFNLKNLVVSIFNKWVYFQYLSESLANIRPTFLHEVKHSCLLRKHIVSCSPVPWIPFIFYFLAASVPSPHHVGISKLQSCCRRILWPQMLPPFCGISFSAFTAVDSVLTMSYKLLKKLLWFWEVDILGFES